MKIIKEIKWKWFYWHIIFVGKKMEFIDKYFRKRYCRYGYHKLRSCGVSYGGTGQRMKHIRFLKCTHCNYLFFAKKSDKERYLKYEKKSGLTKETISALLKLSSGAKPKRLKVPVNA